MTDDKTYKVFKQMNDYCNKAKSTESHFFPRLVGVKCSQSLRTELSIPHHISSSSSGAGRVATSSVGFRLCVIVLPSPVGPVAEGVTAPWSPEPSLAGESHALLFPLQSGYQHNAPDYPQCLAALSLSCREGLAAAGL